MKKLNQFLFRHETTLYGILLFLIAVLIIWGFYELFVMLDQRQALDHVGQLKGAAIVNVARLK
jgi:hypothetical protein